MASEQAPAPFCGSERPRLQDDAQLPAVHPALAQGRRRVHVSRRAFQTFKICSTSNPNEIAERRKAVRRAMWRAAAPPAPLVRLHGCAPLRRLDEGMTGPGKCGLEWYTGLSRRVVGSSTSSYRGTCPVQGQRSAIPAHPSAPFLRRSHLAALRSMPTCYRAAAAGRQCRESSHAATAAATAAALAA